MEKEHDDKALIYMVMGAGFLIHSLIFPPFTITKYKYWFVPVVENFFPSQYIINDLFEYKIKNLLPGMISAIFVIAAYYNPEKIPPPCKNFFQSYFKC